MILLLLPGCATSVDSQVEAGLPASPAPALPTVTTAWEASVTPALRAALSGFHEVEEGVFQAQVADTSAILNDGGFRSGDLSLQFVAWGREGAVEPVRPGKLEQGACSPAKDPMGDCVPRVERTDAGITEWWQGGGASLEQGWDIDAALPGAGALSLELLVEGGLAVAVGEEAMIYAEDGRIWTYGAPLAWDAEGQPLGAWLVVEEGTIRVQVDDQGAVYPITVDPMVTTATTTLTSSDYAYFGYSVAGAGDVNNDGYDDVAIGGFYYNYGDGAVYIYHGSSTGLATTAATRPTSTEYAYFGNSVDGAGDVNNDGYDDIVVGAPYGASYAGRAYVYYGSASGIQSTGFSTLSASSTSYYGFAVGGGGDVNNDGYSDVAVGCYACNSYYGTAYVYYGSSAGTVTSSYTTLYPGYYSYAGYSVANDGDVNGDGYDDVLVGANYYNYGYGATFAYHGSASGASTGFTWGVASSTYAYWGVDVAYAGDTNNDGYDDVVVGAMYANSYYGGAYLFRGSSTGLSTTATTSLTGPSIYSYFGYSVAGLGDISGDGYRDIAVGSYGTYSTYVYEGASTGYSAATTLTGTGYFGFAVDGAGDTNGDGRRELIVGDYSGSSYYGTAYLYSGDVDADADGYGSLTDCNDADATINTGAAEVAADGIDQNCNGGDSCYRDGDRDGYGGTTVVASADLDCTDAGESTTTTDCNDSRATINPAAAETAANGTDENCDGAETCYRDGDRDGYGTTTTVSSTTDLDCADFGESSYSTDCNDSNFYISPGSTEVCDSANADEDCDGLADDADSGVTAGRSTYYVDADADGYGSTTSGQFCDLPAGYANNRTDCNDANAAISPGDPEICDSANVDEDCDGTADDADVGTTGETTWYRDGDSDGYGLSTSAQSLCDQPSGYVADNTDCNDGNVAINPAATEVCDSNNTDENCNGLADNNDPAAAGTSAYYQDSDGDGYGDPAMPGSYCDQASGFVANNTDCDDQNAARSPGLPELCDAADLDEDCDGQADDADSSAPANRSTWYTDADGDSYGDSSTAQLLCNSPAGAVTVAGDCNDADGAISPAAQEICDAANTDEDCDGNADDADSSAQGQSTWYVDLDGDSYGDTTRPQVWCDAPATTVAASGDCDDQNVAINPLAQEICDATDTDEDCDGVADDQDSSAVGQTPWYADSDADGFGDPQSSLGACNMPVGSVADATDCDDSNNSVNPLAVESCNSIDDDCDGGVDDADPEGVPADAMIWYVDGDQDGYGDGAGTPSCVEPSNSVLYAGDCDDSNNAFYPGATETCDDPTDYNCDGSVGYADGDADGYAACQECNDGDAGIRPDAVEVCNFVDDNCDTLVDNNASDAPTWYADTDGDSYGDANVTDVTCQSPEGFVADNTDCADAEVDIHPGATEICNALDDNCDGVIDTDAVDRPTFYADADGDGYGDINSPVLSRDETENITSDTQDCDDTRGTVSPDQPEACEDGMDNNCSGEVDEDCPTDSVVDTAADSDSGGKTEPESCGCSTGEPLSTAGLILLGAVLARRRRKV